MALVRKEIKSLMSSHLEGKESDNWNTWSFVEGMRTIFPLPQELDSEERVWSLSRDEIEGVLAKHVDEMYASREERMGPENMRTLERRLMLRTVDGYWMHHLTAMDNLRQGIGLHAYGQRDPLVMYRTEGSRMFQGLLDRIQHDMVHSIFQVELASGVAARAAPRQKASPMAAASGRQREPVGVGSQKVGRNDQCPCGSGKKYKRCHGTNG